MLKSVNFGPLEAEKIPAGVVQLVERLLAKEKVVSSSLIARLVQG